MPNGPLIVQSDKSLLLEVDHDQAAECRRAIAPFAELERAPEHVHTYRLTPLGLWNARAAGHDAEQVVDALITYSRYPVPHALLVDFHGSPAAGAAFAAGHYHVQGLASQFAALCVQARPGQRVLDLCAAPGGKSLTLVQQMQNTGCLVSGEVFISCLWNSG